MNRIIADSTKFVEFGPYARGVWNLFLSENMYRYEYSKTFLFYNDMAALLVELKQFEEFAWLEAFDSAAAQQVLRDLDIALKNACSKGRLQRFPKHKVSYKIKTATIQLRHGKWEVSLTQEVDCQPEKQSLQSITGYDINSQNTVNQSNVF